MSDFISEDELKTFEGWLKYQAIDPSTLTPAELDQWRAYFDENSKKAAQKVGLMKLKPPLSGELRYAVAVRDGSKLWLTLWVQRSRKGEFFVMVPRADRGWDPHVSYHLDGKFHSKSFGKVGVEKQLQRLTDPFRGTEHLGEHAGHSPKTVGAVCDPAAFSGVVEVPPGWLGPRHGGVVVDLVEPGCEPISWPFNRVIRWTLKDAKPWVVIRAGSKELPSAAT